MQRANDSVWVWFSGDDPKRTAKLKNRASLSDPPDVNVGFMQIQNVTCQNLLHVRT